MKHPKQQQGTGASYFLPPLHLPRLNLPPSPLPGFQLDAAYTPHCADHWECSQVGTLWDSVSQGEISFVEVNRRCGIAYNLSPSGLGRGVVRVGSSDIFC